MARRMGPQTEGILQVRARRLRIDRPKLTVNKLEKLLGARGGFAFPA
jgi:hypothetical protein